MTKLIIPAILATLLLPACSQEPVEVQQQAEQVEPRDYSQLTVAAVQDLAEQGVPGAQVRFATMYYFGQGVPKDLEEAVRWFRLAAEQGDPVAQNQLGYMHTEGEGGPKDDVEAVKWYRMAAVQGSDEAQFSLGYRYGQGEGVPQDYAEAVRWWRANAERGAAKGMFALGFMYEFGQEGVLQDYVQAHKWFNLATLGRRSSASRTSMAFTDIDLAVSRRVELAKKMTPEQVAEAQRLAAKWKPKTWEVIRQELKIGLPE